MSKSAPPTENREKILMIVAGLIFAVVAAWLLNDVYGSAVSTLLKQRNKLRNDVTRLEMATRSESLRRRLDSFMEKSLPADRFRAASEYQNWLIDLSARSGIREPKAEAATAKDSPKEGYRNYTFTFRGKGTLAELAAFLRQFHEYDNLHLIRNVLLKPSKDAKYLDITLNIDALAMTQSANRTLVMHLRDPETDPDVAERMSRSVIERDFFVDAKSATPVVEITRPTSPPKFDPTPYCFVTAIVESFGKTEVWLGNRISGQLDRLHVGDRFRIGEMPCTLTKIDFNSITVEADGGLYRIPFGYSFDDAEYLGDVTTEDPPG